jgi:hypothetical protein
VLYFPSFETLAPDKYVYSVSLAVKKHPLPFGNGEYYETETSFYFSWEAISGQYSASFFQISP